MFVTHLKCFVIVMYYFIRVASDYYKGLLGVEELQKETRWIKYA